MLYFGSVTISLHLAHSGTCYKYVVMKKGEEHWEDLDEYASNSQSIVNRGLSIPEQYLKAGGK